MRLWIRPFLAACATPLVLIACAVPTSPAPASDPALTPSVSAPTPPQSQTAFLVGLSQLDSHLVANPDRSLSRARNVCLDIQGGKPESTVVSNARDRFSDDVVALSPEQAAEVVRLARTNVCDS
jgi:Protein of unknown function (DUF732)